jgi:hypothetical protein
MKKIESWSDITIGQYQEIMMIETDNDLTRFIESMAICLDIDPQDIRNLPYSEYKSLQQRFSFIGAEPQGEILDRFEIDGKKFGLMKDMNLMTAGMFIDAEEFKKDPIANLHNTIAIIYRPIIEETDDDFKIEPHKAEGFERRSNLFKDKLSITTVMGAVLFFSILGMELSISSLESFQKEYQKEVTKTKTKTTRTRTKKANKTRSTKTGDSTI